MSAVDFRFGSLIYGKQNSFGVFDADINPSVRSSKNNAILTLHVRIFFHRVAPSQKSSTYSDADGSQVPIQAWTSDLWSNWKRKFISQCQRKWDGHFWLITPSKLRSLDWPDQRPTHRCNLACRFRLSEQTTRQGAHAVIPVVRIKGKHNFRSHMLLYSDRDLERENLTKGSPFYTHLHEIGHLIGLDHPGAGLPGCAGGGESACYAAADGDDRSIMGRGSHINADHATPWIKAASLLTGTPPSDWKVSLSLIRPVLI